MKSLTTCYMDLGEEEYIICRTDEPGTTSVCHTHRTSARNGCAAGVYSVGPCPSGVVMRPWLSTPDPPTRSMC